MNARQFYDLVVRMRQSQKAYFRSRTSSDLRLSKELERQVDAEIAREAVQMADALCVLVVLGGNNLDEDYDDNNDSSLSINNKNQEHNE